MSAVVLRVYNLYPRHSSKLGLWFVEALPLALLRPRRLQWRFEHRWQQQRAYWRRAEADLGFFELEGLGTCGGHRRTLVPKMDRPRERGKDKGQLICYT